MNEINDNHNNRLTAHDLGMHSLNFSAQHNSPSRSVMYAGHFAQRVVFDGVTEKRIQTGMDKEFSKYTFAVRMPKDGVIRKLIDRYERSNAYGSVNYRPEILVMYEVERTHELDYFSVTEYASYHQFFGYRYKPTANMEKLVPGKAIAEGTVFADSPSVSDNGGFMSGIEANVAFMSIPSVAEDGIMVSRDFLPKLKFRIYEQRTVEFGSKAFPLNLYGDETHYKPFPDLGEYIREDGLLMMLRDYNVYDLETAPVEMSIYDTRTPDYMFDSAKYVRGGKGRVVDIKVFGNNSNNKNLPPAMGVQAEKYRSALLHYYQEILKAYWSMDSAYKKMTNGQRRPVSPKMNRLLVEAMALTNHPTVTQKGRNSLSLLHRSTAVDEYRVEFTIEYEITPDLAFKGTDQHGGKGVFVKIEEPENMPVDQDGNRADMVMDAGATISRMNLGRLYEHYLGAAARDMSKRIRTILGVQPKSSKQEVYGVDPQKQHLAYSELLSFYELIGPDMHGFFTNLNAEEKIEHLWDVVRQGIYLYIPIDNPKNIPDIVRDVQAKYPPIYGPVSYVGNSGERCITKNNVRIAPLYVMLLDKIADDWSSVSSGRLQHFGVLTPQTKSEKFSYPFRNSPVRTIGETEGRIFAGYCGRVAFAEMMDRSNSPYAQRNIVWNILKSKQPTNIDQIVDRKEIPLGNSKSLALVQHMLQTTGIRLVYKPESR